MVAEETIAEWKAKIAQIGASRQAIIAKLNAIGQSVPTDEERAAAGEDPVRLHEIASYLKTLKKDCRIRVVDGSLQALPQITPDSVLVNGAPQSTAYQSDGYIHVSTHQTDEFQLRIEKTGYSPYEKTETFASLDTKQIPIVPLVDGYRAVFTWGEEPRDLDTHCFIYQNGLEAGHVYFANKTYVGTETTGTNVTLDVDIVTSYGPETLTISPFSVNLTYRYYIYLFSGSGTIGQNNAANVIVYAQDTATTITVADSANTGRWWHVFDIEDGVFSVVNRFQEPSA